MRYNNSMLDGMITWAEIDLDAIAWNGHAFRQFIGDGIDIFAVVKANAYGHGAVPVAQAALQAGANRLAVHRLVEAIELRDGGIEAPILVMGYTPPAGAGVVVQKRLTPSVITREFAEALRTPGSGSGYNGACAHQSRHRHEPLRHYAFRGGGLRRVRSVACRALFWRACSPTLPQPIGSIRAIRSSSLRFSTRF